MKKIFKGKLICIIMAVAFAFCSFALPISAGGMSNNYYDILKPYMDELELINDELGVDYCIVSSDEMSEEEYAEMVEFFSMMSISDFRNYIMAAHQNDITNASADVLPTEQIAPAAYSNTQRYYYSGGSNYLSINSTLYTADGYERYYSVNNGNSNMVSYPAYYATSLSSTISSDKRTVNCSFNCTKYITAYVSDTSFHVVRVTFTAGGGDVYGTAQI